MRGRVFYGWIMVAVAFAVILIGAGTRAAPGALLLPIQSDTGWTVGQITIAGAAGLLLLGLGGPVSGILIDRFGVRRTTVAALLLTAGGMAASGLATEVWQLVLLFGVVSGFGAGLVSSSLGPIVATRWFVKRRGLVVGVFGAAASAGQLLFIPFLSGLGTGQGWRIATIILGGLVALTIIPALLLLRERPESVGLRALGPPRMRPSSRPSSDPGILQRAFRRPEFWLLAGTFFVCGATSNGVVGQHFIAHAVDHGFTASAAAGALALMGVFNFTGTIVSGYLTDRFDPRKLPPDLLRLPGGQPAVPAGAPQLDRHRRLQRPVRARLHRDRPADRRPRRGRLRSQQRRDRLRLGLRRAHARRGDPRPGGRDHSRPVRRPTRWRTSRPAGWRSLRASSSWRCVARGPRRDRQPRRPDAGAGQGGKRAAPGYECRRGNDAAASGLA